MQNIFVFLTLAVVQGIAEFLPISSSGHLALFEQIPYFRQSISSLGSDIELFINVALHVATLIAVIIFLRNDLSALIKGVFTSISARNTQSKEIKRAINIIVACIPAGIVGILLHDFFESLFSSMLAVLFMLIINGFILLSTKIIPINDRKLEEIGIFRSIIVGLFQTMAIIPGISRSGSTIAGGMIMGLEPEESARFSFLMAIPVIAGAGLLETVKLLKKGFNPDLILPVGIALIVTILVSLISLRVLFALVRKVRIDIFGYYTIAVGICGLLYIYMSR